MTTDRLDEALAALEAAVQRADVPILVEAPGTVRSRHEATLSAQVSGAVQRVAAVAGQAVRAGEVLVELEGSELAAHAAAAHARATSAEEALSEAERELARTQTLFERQARTQSELDQAQTRRAEAQAELEAARQAAEAADTTLSHARVVAPFDGVLLARMVDPGDLATPGLPLVEVYAPGEPRLEARVAQELLAALPVGTALDVVLAAAEGGDGGPRTTRGVVEELRPAVDPATRTGLLVLALPELEEVGAPAVLPGTSGRALVPQGTRPAALVPAAALVVRGEVQMVFAPWVDEGGRARARMRLVRAGRPGAGGLVELQTGAEGLERVITSGAADLRDGAPIRVTDDAAAEGGGRGGR